MPAELYAAIEHVVGDGLPELTRGDLVAADDPVLEARPQSFRVWVAPMVRLLTGGTAIAAPVVTESFATGDRVLLRGDVLDRRDGLVGKASRCVVDWQPPPVRPVATATLFAGGPGQPESAAHRADRKRRAATIAAWKP